MLDIVNEDSLDPPGVQHVMEHSFHTQSIDTQHFNIPASCPFTISQIQCSPSSTFSAWLIREHDEYGEYPHIYAKLSQASNNNQAASVIVLSDTGCGTEVRNPDSSAREQPASWNIRTFLEYTINPDGRIPYLVISTHCHYDHILGFYKLPPTDPTPHRNEDCFCTEKPLPPPTQVLASAKGTSFITPYRNLQKHSLCSTVTRKAAEYTVSTWAFDFMQVNYQYTCPSPSRPSLSNDITIPTSLTIIHTQGHTPDSLSWYDSNLRLICVGDSFYTKESTHTKHSPWGPEPAMPTIFCAESDLAAWWGGMGKILGFVREKNGELEGEAKEGHEFVMVNTPEDQDEQPPHPSPIEPTFQTSPAKSPYLQVNQRPSPSPPSSAKTPPYTNSPAPSRVRLCAAHTTFNLDAEAAILEMKDFMAAILRDKVPSKRAEQGSRGEERWLWDYALDMESKSKDKYSVLAPLRVVERGRQTIPKEQWALQ